MAKLELIGVTKTYGKTVAVNDLTLTVEDNEFFCIFGPPVSGKTTILRLLLGLESPSSGEVRIAGQSVDTKLPAERNLAMVFQNLALFPHMTARENLAFPLVERKVPQAEQDARITEVAEKLHIVPLLGKLPAHLSGGERQRVAIGRALVRDTDALLMDEPISALDARLREEMRVELKRLQRELHRTLVYVTHDQEEAMSIADRLCVLRMGEIAQIGLPQEIYGRPTNRYVAEVIGSPAMNFIAGEIDASTGRFSAAAMDLSLGFAIDGRASSAGDLGVRPEDIRIARQAPAGHGVQGKVYEVEPLGAYTVVDISMGDSLLRAQITGQPRFELGEPVFLSIEAGKCHLFDGETGERLATGTTD